RPFRSSKKFPAFEIPSPTGMVARSCTKRMMIDTARMRVPLPVTRQVRLKGNVQRPGNGDDGRALVTFARHSSVSSAPVSHQQSVVELSVEPVVELSHDELAMATMSVTGGGMTALSAITALPPELSTPKTSPPVLSPAGISNPELSPPEPTRTVGGAAGTGV